jgi:hypothetical protein
MKRPKWLRILEEAVKIASTHHKRDEARGMLSELPLVGALFLAVVGTPGEYAEVDSPLVLLLSAIRDTIDGWARTPSPSTALAYVPIGELDRLAHRIGAAIIIAQRTERKGGAS